MKVLIEIETSTFLELQILIGKLKSEIAEITRIPDYRVHGAQDDYEKRIFSLLNSHLYIDSNIGSIHCYTLEP